MGSVEELDAVAHKTLTEKYLKRFSSFLEDHSSHLLKLLDSTGDDNVENEDFGFQKNGLSMSRMSSSIMSSFPVNHKMWSFPTDPVQMEWVPIQNTCSSEELIMASNSPERNPDVQKVLLVLVTLADQLIELREKCFQDYIDQLILYGDGIDTETSYTKEADGHVSMCKFLHVLYDINDFVQNCVSLLVHVMRQLAAIFKESKPHVVTITGVNFHRFLLELSEFLSVFVILDEVIVGQVVLQEQWTKYGQIIKSVRADCNSFGVNSSDLIKMEQELTILSKSLLSGRIFHGIIDRTVMELGKTYGKNFTLFEKLTENFLFISTLIETNFSSGNEDRKPVSFAALFVFVASLFPTLIDTKKHFPKDIWDKKYPAVHLIGNVIWKPESFFNSYSFGNSKLLDAKSVQNSRATFLQLKMKTLRTDVLGYHVKVSAWATRLQEIMYAKDMTQLRPEDVCKRCTYILQGLKLAQLLNHNLQLLINLHGALSRSLSRQDAYLLCQILELLKLIQCVFFRFNVQICESSANIVQNVIHTALVTISSARKAMMTDPNRKAEECRSDAWTILNILENTFRGPPTRRRLLIARTALDWASSVTRFWRDDDVLTVLMAATDRISALIELSDDISRLCDGSVIYWHRNMLSTFFRGLYDSELELTKLPLICLVLQDCVRLLQKSPHNDEAKKSFISEVESSVTSDLVEKLCKELENDLRLQSHSHLPVQVEEFSPFRVRIQEFKCHLEVPSILLHNKRINFKQITGYYLSKTFYNLASVALHDWQSYATMRVLAFDKYNLHILEDHLPGHSLEQGLDILEIVRNLNKFVTEFTYNLNNQVFVQVNSPNKHLDTVNIRHLANSMRTHGPGMANTTINITYHFLQAKMRNFSQFLFDEQIKSRLGKDMRIFKQGRQEHAANAPQAYFPYDRALKFQKGIRKLGLTSEGFSPLDQFRFIITHVGNALGFVRLVKSGGLHFLAAGCRFVPDLEDIPDFADLSNIMRGVSLLPEDTLRMSCSLVNSCLSTLTSSFSGGVDYFGLLVSAFESPCRDSKNSHLKNFYVIIPALTLSYVEHLRSCKEKLGKKTKSTTIFTDDGFPMGVAYLLKVLGQDADFDSLGWFASVTVRLSQELAQAQQMIQESKKDEKLQQASTLTAKRVQDIMAEFDLLSYNLSSARIFFQQGPT